MVLSAGNFGLSDVDTGGGAAGGGEDRPLPAAARAYDTTGAGAWDRCRRARW